MSAKRSESRTGSSRATELAAVLICQYRFAAIACGYGSLRLEGLMVLTGLG